MVRNSIKYISQNFFKELSTTSVDWLLGNVGDKIRIETTFSVEIFAVSTTSSPFLLNYTDGMVGDGWFKDPQNGFKDFNIGDTVLYFNKTDGGSAAFNIIDKIDNSLIQLDRKFSSTPDGFPENNAVMSVTTPITAVKYRYNFVNNTGGKNDFISAIDGVSEQEFISKSKSGSDTSLSAMEPQNALTWQNGVAGSMTLDFAGSAVAVCQIKGVAIDPGTSSGYYNTQFTIVHYTYISPYILFLMTIPPFKDDNNLKFIYQIDAMYEYTDPNFLRSLLFNKILGNVGWYNENFATGKTNYSISNVVYKIAGKVVPSPRLDTTETILTFDILNTVDAPFSNNNTKFIVAFFKKPADVSEYQGDNTLLDTNFLWDRAKQVVGSAAVNGDNYGGAHQALKGISATFVSTSKITVTVKIDMVAAVIASFSASGLPTYKIICTIQNHTLATDVSDLVSLEVDEDIFSVVTTDPLMLRLSNVFLRHPEADPLTEGVTPGYPNSEYDYSLWIEGIYSYNLSVFFDFSIAGINSFSAVGLSTIDQGMQMLVDLINVTAGEYIASVNTVTKKFVCNPDGVHSANHVIWATASTGGTHPTIVNSVALLADGGTFDVFPEDEIVACSTIALDSNGRTGDVILITSVISSIVASNGTKEFELDKYGFITSYPLIGYTQDFDAQSARNYHIPIGTIRRYAEVKRDSSRDTGALKIFSMSYPVIWRWEDWIKAENVDASFLDSSLPNKGFNEWWYHYKATNGGGTWSLKYKLIVNATKNGIPQQYPFEQYITPHDYASNPAYTTKRVCTFNADQLTPIQSGGGGGVELQTGASTTQTINGQAYNVNIAAKKYLNASKKTLLAILFTKSVVAVDPEYCVDIEIFKQGGSAGRRRYSSKWVGDADTWFSSIDGSGKVVMAEFGNDVVGLCYIDPASLNFPSGVISFASIGRIYEKVGSLLETDDSVDLKTDDSIQIITD